MAKDSLSHYYASMFIDSWVGKREMYFFPLKISVLCVAVYEGSIKWVRVQNHWFLFRLFYNQMFH